MQKIVVVTADPPIPLTGGGSRTYYFTEALAKITSCKLFVLFPINRNELSLDFLRLFNGVSISKIGFGNNGYHGLKSLLFYLKLILTPWLFSKHELILNANYFISNTYKGKSFISLLIYNLATYSSVYYSFFLYRMGYAIPVRALERKKQLDNVYRNILDDLEDAQLLWLDFSTLLPLFRDVIKGDRKYKVVINAHNIEFLLLEGLAEVAQTKLAKKWHNLQADILKQEELYGFDCADLVVVCSDHDKKFIRKHIQTANIEVMPNGVDLNYFRPNLETQLTPFPSLLFTGTMGYYPNKEAVQHFVSDIFPHVKKAFPTCKFIVAGADAASVFPDYIKRNDIIIHSSPDDMRPIYNEAWVIVVPLKTGSGTRLKILEAMAMEKPVVSSSIGAEGILVNNGVNILIADDNIRFAESICELINNSQQSSTIASAGKIFVSELYNWEKIRTLLTYKVTSLLKYDRNFNESQFKKIF